MAGHLFALSNIVFSHTSVSSHYGQYANSTLSLALLGMACHTTYVPMRETTMSFNLQMVRRTHLQLALIEYVRGVRASARTGEHDANYIAQCIVCGIIK